MAIFVSAVLALKSWEKASKADCLRPIVFYFSVSSRLLMASTDLLPSLGVKAGRERGGTLGWNATEMGRSHIVGRTQTHSSIQSFTMCLLSVILGLIFVFVLRIKEQGWASGSSWSRRVG